MGDAKLPEAIAVGAAVGWLDTAGVAVALLPQAHNPIKARPKSSLARCAIILANSRSMDFLRFNCGYSQWFHLGYVNGSI
ncbi:MAG: hypothetical protein BZY81_08440 [SAR202 cluster bacterium Io17-Chloro-G4]|nr:MAG: hypothetical protein BZY81_08440 [SAR202 cluster bacterium Io17-Chloro-G4]